MHGVSQTRVNLIAKARKLMQQADRNQRELAKVFSALRRDGMTAAEIAKACDAMVTRAGKTALCSSSHIATLARWADEGFTRRSPYADHYKARVDGGGHQFFHYDRIAAATLAKIDKQAPLPGEWCTLLQMAHTLIERAPASVHADYYNAKAATAHVAVTVEA